MLLLLLLLLLFCCFGEVMRVVMAAARVSELLVGHLRQQHGKAHYTRHAVTVCCSFYALQSGSLWHISRKNCETSCIIQPESPIIIKLNSMVSSTCNLAWLQCSLEQQILWVGMRTLPLSLSAVLERPAALGSPALADHRLTHCSWLTCLADHISHI